MHDAPLLFSKQCRLSRKLAVLFQCWQGSTCVCGWCVGVLERRDVGACGQRIKRKQEEATYHASALDGMHRLPRAHPMLHTRTNCAHCTHAVCTLHARSVHTARTHCARCAHALCTLHARIVHAARTHALCTLHARTHCAYCMHALCTVKGQEGAADWSLVPCSCANELCPSTMSTMRVVENKRVP